MIIQIILLIIFAFLFEYGMAKIHFDNILMRFKLQVLYTGATAVSAEGDLDIPRGFIVKIKKLRMEVVKIEEDIEGISVDKVLQYLGALILDPDDATTLVMPNNTVDHDVLEAIEVGVAIIANAADTSVAITINGNNITSNYESEDLDVFTARNIRLNGDVTGTDAADGTEAILVAYIDYTLEKITDATILELLNLL